MPINNQKFFQFFLINKLNSENHLMLIKRYGKIFFVLNTIDHDCLKFYLRLINKNLKKN